MKLRWNHKHIYVCLWLKHAIHFEICILYKQIQYWSNLSRQYVARIPRCHKCLVITVHRGAMSAGLCLFECDLLHNHVEWAAMSSITLTISAVSGTQSNMVTYPIRASCSTQANSRYCKTFQVCKTELLRDLIFDILSRVIQVNSALRFLWLFMITWCDRRKPNSAIHR